MLEPMTPQDFNRFRSQLRNRLEPHSPDLVEALRAVLARHTGKRIHRFEFRVIEDDVELGDCFPVVLDVPKGSGELLDVRDPLCPPEWMAGYEALNPEQHWRDFAAEVIIEWFAECWTAAGGRESPVPAVIGTHDSIRQYDLRTGRWASE